LVVLGGLMMLCLYLATRSVDILMFNHKYEELSDIIDIIIFSCFIIGET